ncbi:YdcF family protein [soil metagenome]
MAAMPTPTDTVWALLTPGNFIVLLLLLSFLALSLRRHAFGRRLVGLALLLTLLPALLPVTDLLAQPLETRAFAPNPLPERVDGVVVLGGSVDWQTSRAWGQLNTNSAGERMMAAAALAERYPDAKLILTGLVGKYIPEEFQTVATAKTFFASPAFEGRKIHYLYQARSTYEEATLSLARAQPQRGETWLLVTSAWHMPRALETFRAQGWTLVPYPVDYQSNGRIGLEPSLDVIGRLNDLNKIVREWGALFVYRQLGRTQRLLPERFGS